MFDPSWQAVLSPEFESAYMQQLRTFLRAEKDRRKVIFPPSKQVFEAFLLTPFEQVKVVILGQDPYHGPRQAHGLCFSVSAGVRSPPSLVNIYKELHADLGIPPATHGDLTAWAKQGVLLLNSVLTVEQGRAGSHQGQGWEQLTDKIIQRLNDQRAYIVFLLWGAYAQKKGQFVDSQRHCVLKAAHPSPFSATNGFFGCHPFSKANQYLRETGQTPIDWALPPDPVKQSAPGVSDRVVTA